MRIKLISYLGGMHGGRLFGAPLAVFSLAHRFSFPKEKWCGEKSPSFRGTVLTVPYIAEQRNMAEIPFDRKIPVSFEMGIFWREYVGIEPTWAVPSRPQRF